MNTIALPTIHHTLVVQLLVGSDLEIGRQRFFRVSTMYHTYQPPCSMVAVVQLYYPCFVRILKNNLEVCLRVG